MAGTVDDHSTDEFRRLKDEYAFVLSLTGDSKPWAEELLRAYFSHGPVDREGRERYTVFKTEAKLLGRQFGGRAIYNPRDWQFWYSDLEYGISCVFEFRDSTVRWTGPMVYPKAPSAEDKEGEEVWQVDPQDKAEYHLIGIKLRHEVLLDFLGAGWLPLVQRPTETAAAESTQPQPESEQPQSTSAPASKAPLTDKVSLKKWLPGAVERWPPYKQDTDDYPAFLRARAPKVWSRHYIQNELSILAKERPELFAPKKD